MNESQKSKSNNTFRPTYISNKQSEKEIKNQEPFRLFEITLIFYICIVNIKQLLFKKIQLFDFLRINL